MHFISAFLFSSIPAFQLHFIPALFICVSLLLPHIFSCFFFLSFFALLPFRFSFCFPRPHFSFRSLHVPLPLFHSDSIIPTPPPSPFTPIPPHHLHPTQPRTKPAGGGTAAPPLSALQCGGRSPGGSSAPLRPPQQLSAAPPPGPPPGAWSRCRPPRATNRRCRSRAGFSARRGRRESCCSVFLPTPFLLLLPPAGGV